MPSVFVYIIYCSNGTTGQRDTIESRVYGHVPGLYSAVNIIMIKDLQLPANFPLIISRH